MKLIVVFLTVVSLGISAKGFSQTVTFSGKNVSLEKALSAIGQQTGYAFFYNDADIATAKTITVSLKSVSLITALDEILSNQQLDYSIQGKTVFIRRDSIIVVKTINAISKEPALNIHGKVTDKNGHPLIGVSVVLKGTSTGTTTDNNGKYSLTLPDGNGTLVFSYVGFTKQEVEVEGQSVINIVMKPNVSSLDQLVVVGYGTQERKDVTGAIASVQSKDFVKGFASDVAQLIRGKVAGLAVITPDANPVNTSELNLRGITTLSGSTQPLVLIDGVPGTLSSVAPENVASIDVLKDGSAAAIYGTRGTNGVILITTKTGDYNMDPIVNVRVSYTTQRITKRLDFMSPSQYRELVAEHKPGAVDYGANTDWLDQVTRKPLSQIYNINLRGGSKSTSYNVNLTYKDLNGIIKKSNNVLFYPSVRIIHTMFKGMLKFDAWISGYEQHYFSGTDGGSYNAEVYKNALIYNPTAPVKDSNGNWTEHIEKTEYMNPVSLLMETHGKIQNTDLRTIASTTFNPISEVSIKLLASRDLYNSFSGYSTTRKQFNNLRSGLDGYASRGATREEEDMLELTADYNKRFGLHRVTGLIGYSWIKDNFQNYWMQNWDFPTDQFSYNNIGSGLALGRGEAPEFSTQTENKLIGYFARINYSYKDKYLMTASIRREGSSKFGMDDKYGNFPSISIGWNISREPFMEDIHFISTLKLRGGYGITGTEPTNPYESLATLNFNQKAFINGQWIYTPDLSQNPNPNLSWEKKHETNIGLDFGLYDNRINGSIDVYKRVTKGLLFDYPVATPPYLYNNILANAASMENKGIEISIDAIPVKTKNLQWNTSINYSYNKNKLLSLSNGDFQLASGYLDVGSTGEPIQQPTHRVQIGSPIGDFFGFKSIGIDDDGHWIIEGKDGKPKPIAEETFEDKRVIGNGLPKTYLSWNNTIRFENFDLNIIMRGAFGFQILNLTKLFYTNHTMLNRANLLTSAYDKIYGEHVLADDQELQYVSYYIENGNYWKIDNITLGYNFNISSKFLKSLRIYASASNVKTFSGYSGIDPEVNILGLTPGVDNNFRYPATSSYTLGALFTF